MKLNLVVFVITIISSYNFPQQSKLSKEVNYLSTFIASDHFVELKETNSDLALVDSIYLRAIAFTKKDYSEALLALTFATVPYKKIQIVIPIIKEVIYYPLIAADDSTSILKIKTFRGIYFTIRLKPATVMWINLLTFSAMRLLVTPKTSLTCLL